MWISLKSDFFGELWQDIMQAWTTVMDQRNPPTPTDQWKYGLLLRSHWNVEMCVLPFASVSKGFFMLNHSNENKFDWHENKLTGEHIFYQSEWSRANSRVGKETTSNSSSKMAILRVFNNRKTSPPLYYYVIGQTKFFYL